MKDARVQLTSFESRLLESWPSDRWRGLGIAVGVSGGPDSVALLRGMRRLTQDLNADAQTQLHVLHFNHGWRGRASENDEEFVITLCKQLGLPCRIGRPDAYEKSSEAAARQQRYEFFRRAAENLGARYVLTAHTREDQVETVLHRVMRGTGIVGLAGIPAVRRLSEAVSVVRPLLTHSRADAMEYLSQLGQTFQTDESNQDTRFTRNRIRHELLPLLAEQYNPSVAEALLKLSGFAVQTQDFISHVAGQHLADCLQSCSPEQLVFNAAALGRHPAVLQREILASVWRNQRWPEREMGAEQWRGLVELISHDSAKIELPGGIRVKRDGTSLILNRTCE